MMVMHPYPLTLKIIYPQQKKSYELDLNHGFMTQLSKAQYGYSDMLVGKKLYFVKSRCLFLLTIRRANWQSGFITKITLLLQCAITQEQSLAIVARTGDATQGTIIGSAEFKLSPQIKIILFIKYPIT